MCLCQAELAYIHNDPGWLAYKDKAGWVMFCSHEYIVVDKINFSQQILKGLCELLCVFTGL
jgi:hypothetical protein